MPHSHAKIRSKSSPQKLKLVMAKLYRIVTHSNVALSLIKTILCKNNSIFLARTIENQEK